MDNTSLIIYVACIIFIFLIGRIFVVPIKFILKMLINSVLGGLLIYIINVIGTSFNFHIGLNVFTAAFIGILGIPGSICLVFLKLVLNL